MKKVILILIVVFSLYGLYGNFENSEIEVSDFFTISGIKPSDVTVTVYVEYFGRGKSCPGSTWNEATGELSGGIYRNSYTFKKNLASDEEHYKFHLPYKNIEVDKGCIAKLSKINIVSYREKEDDRLAGLRIEGGDSINQPTITMSDHLEERNCGSIENVNIGGYSCELYINNKPAFPHVIQKGSVNLNYSDINKNSNLVYDIVKGADY